MRRFLKKMKLMWINRNGVTLTPRLLITIVGFDGHETVRVKTLPRVTMTMGDEITMCYTLNMKFND